MNIRQVTSSSEDEAEMERILGWRQKERVKHRSHCFLGSQRGGTQGCDCTVFWFVIVISSSGGRGRGALYSSLALTSILSSTNLEVLPDDPVSDCNSDSSPRELDSDGANYFSRGGGGGGLRWLQHQCQ